MDHPVVRRGQPRRVAWQRVSHGLYRCGEVDVLHAWRLVPPAEALLGCARDLSLLDLVVLVDSALQLSVRAPRAGGRRLGTSCGGTAAAPCPRPVRRAGRVTVGLLRILHVVCDIEVEPQYDVFENGLFVARGDLWLAGTRVLHEYDGSDHLPRARQRKDLRRSRRISNPDWIRAWHRLLAQSTFSQSMFTQSMFTPTGTARFRERIGLVQRSGHERQELRGDSSRS